MNPSLQPRGSRRPLTSPADQRTPPSHRGWDPGRAGGAFQGCECLGKAPSIARHSATPAPVHFCSCVPNDKVNVRVRLLSFPCSSKGKEQLSVLCS